MHSGADGISLEIRAVGAAGQLAVGPVMWTPELNVVLLSGRGAQVAGGDIDDPIRDAKFLPDLLLDTEDLLMDLLALLG